MNMKMKTCLLLILILSLAGCLNAVVQEKVTALETQIQSNPTDANAHRELGTLWFNEGHDQKAVEHLSLAASLEPQNADTLTTLGTAYARLGDYTNAIRVLTAAQKTGAAKVDFALGSALLGAGQYDQGVAAIRQALKKDPSLASMVQVTVGAPNAEAIANELRQASEQDRAMQEVLQQTYSDLKEQIRQDVREQIAEDILINK